MGELNKKISGVYENSSQGQCDAVIRIKKEFSKEDFLRNTLIKLSKNINTPVDILSAEFSEVTEGRAECLSMTADVSIDYTCMVGYDREEQYADTEEYYDNGVKKKRMVLKTKTVTDWSNYTGKNKSEEFVIVYNDRKSENDHLDSEELKEVVCGCKQESYENGEGDGFEPKGSAMDRAYNLAGEQCYSRVKLPGDHINGENWSGTAEVKELHGFILPTFSTEYEYNGKRYNSKSFACGVLSSKVEVPENGEIRNTGKAASKKAKPILAVALTVILASFVLSVLAYSSLVPQLGSGDWYLLPFFGGIALLVVYFVVKNKFQNLMLMRNQTAKRDNLINALKERGLTPLTAEELAQFDK